MNNCYLNKGVQIFISYRREGGRDVARNIYDRLSLAGYNTFFDYNSIQNGVIDSQIYEAINKATDFVLILSTNALNRCVNRDDWVRKEIEHALLQNKNIVLLSTDENVVFPDNLPESLHTLRSRQITILSQVYYDRSIEQLKSALMSKPVKHDHVLVYFLWSVGLFIIVGVFWLGLFYFSSNNTNPMKGYQATAYLMRYDKLRLRYDCDINDAAISLFHYDDSIDQQSVMHIYPVSDYIDYQPGQIAKLVSSCSTMTIKNAKHSPTIQLKLHSMNKQTLVLTSAELQIDEYRYDDQPAFCFNISDHELEVHNIGALVVNKGVIEYSILHEGESFTTFNKRQTINLNPDYASITLSRRVTPTDSIVGRLVLQDGTSYGFCGRNRKEKMPDVINYSLPIPVFDLKNEKSQSYKFDDFHRSLVKGEIDEEVAFQLRAPYNCVFRIRLKMVSSQEKILYSNYLYVKCIGNSSSLLGN